MNCLNSNTMQAFLDNELSAERKFAVERHLKNCIICQNNLGSYRHDLIHLKNLLNTGIPELQTIVIPVFNKPIPTKQRRLANIFVYAAAAVVATFIGITAVVNHQNNRLQELQNIAIQEHEIMQQASMNEQWQERMITITITDENGQIIEQFNTAN
ncbi:MAG: zf-HC2 domain-containing protein [Salinivirgaceae bacterium]